MLSSTGTPELTSLKCCATHMDPRDSEELRGVLLAAAAAPAAPGPPPSMVVSAPLSPLWAPEMLLLLALLLLVVVAPGAMAAKLLLEAPGCVAPASTAAARVCLTNSPVLMLTGQRTWEWEGRRCRTSKGGRPCV